MPYIIKYDYLELRDGNSKFNKIVFESKCIFVYLTTYHLQFKYFILVSILKLIINKNIK